jgi:hypothetical protein
MPAFVAGVVPRLFETGFNSHKPLMDRKKKQ